MDLLTSEEKLSHFDSYLKLGDRREQNFSAIIDANVLTASFSNHGFNMFNSFNSTQPITDGLTLIKPNQLFNILMQNETYPSVSDSDYLLLLDARRRETYDESHIVLARHASKTRTGSYGVPCELRIETKRHIVVYDGIANSLTNESAVNSEAACLAKRLWQAGSRNAVKILQGGYMLFSKLYPFLRTSKIVYVPQELDRFYVYPFEIIPQKLYVGNWNHGFDAKIQKDLKISAYVNCCRQKQGQINVEHLEKDADNMLYKRAVRQCPVLQLATPDTLESTLCEHLYEAVNFIDKWPVVLVFSRHAVSRAPTIVIAYVMWKNKVPLQKAYDYVKCCNAKTLPNANFLQHLVKFESKVLGKQVTTLDL